jgi:hypothetical protein
MTPSLGRGFVGCTAIAILTACVSSPSPSALSRASQIPSVRTVRQAITALPGVARILPNAPAPRGGTSRMIRNASQGPLLYVADFSDWTVNIYDYPAGSLVGKLTGQKDVSGECVDPAGNVYIVAEGAAETVEYAHGGTAPIATFKSPSGFLPVSCAIDPSTGDLAVANLESGTSKNPFPGDVAIYRHGHARPTKFQASNIYSYYFLGYDNAGNLFVDGSSGRPGVSVRFEYAELPNGDKRMKPITLKGGSIAFPGNVQWDGSHIAIGDQDNAVIYQTRGAKIVGSTPLTSSSDVVGYFIDGGTVVCPDAGNASVEFYNYPAGGAPTGSITGFDEPLAAVVSM